jgi:hypothetical protein
MDQIPALSKEYSPLLMHEPSIQFYLEPLETRMSTPETRTTTLSPHHPTVSEKQLDKPSPLSPTAVGYFSLRGDLLGLGT